MQTASTRAAKPGALETGRRERYALTIDSSAIVSRSVRGPYERSSTRRGGTWRSEGVLRFREDVEGVGVANGRGEWGR